MNRRYYLFVCFSQTSSSVKAAFILAAILPGPKGRGKGNTLTHQDYPKGLHVPSEH
jgi:hypothetical protein